MLATLGNREVPIPDHIDSFHLQHEAPSCDKTPLEFVLEVDDERHRLEKEAEHIMHVDRELQREWIDVLSKDFTSTSRIYIDNTTDSGIAERSRPLQAEPGFSCQVRT